jgi:hypothetical protein
VGKRTVTSSPCGLRLVAAIDRDASARLQAQSQGRGHCLSIACPAGLFERTVGRYFLRNPLEHRDGERADFKPVAPGTTFAQALHELEKNGPSGSLETSRQ